MPEFESLFPPFVIVVFPFRNPFDNTGDRVRLPPCDKFRPVADTVAQNRLIILNPYDGELFRRFLFER